MPGIYKVVRKAIERIRGYLRDEGHILDLYNLSFLKAFLMFATGRSRFVFGGGKAERVEGVTPGVLRWFRAGKILVLLKITVRVVTIILGALGVVKGLGEILRLGFCKCSKKHSKGVIGWVTVEKS